MERKKISRERLEELFREVTEEAVRLGIPLSRNISGPVINTRAKARFGCCKAGKKAGLRTAYIIEISDQVLAAPEKRIKEIIAHELLHTCRGCMNHGKKWKEYAEILHKAAGYEISRTASHESFGIEKESKARAEEDYKYVIICRSCGGKILRKRRCRLTENTHLYRCGKCGGKLELIEKNTTSCR